MTAKRGFWLPDLVGGVGNPRRLFFFCFSPWKRVAIRRAQAPPLARTVLGAVLVCPTTSASTQLSSFSTPLYHCCVCSLIDAVGREQTNDDDDNNNNNSREKNIKSEVVSATGAVFFSESVNHEKGEIQAEHPRLYLNKTK